MTRLPGAVAGAVLLCASMALAAPPLLHHQGVLLDGGVLVDGSVPVTFAIFADPTGGAALWSEAHPAVVADAGRFEVTLGLSVAFPESLFAADALWLELTVDGDTLVPRRRLTSVPWAFRAGAAEVSEGLVDGAAVHDLQLSGDPTASQLAIDGVGTVIDADGRWVGGEGSVPGAVPIGTIIDWFAWSPSAPIPDGWQVCDGSPVTDMTSPLFGVALPDLVERVTAGVASAAEVGTSGGANAIDLGHQHGIDAHTHGLPAHTHDAPSHTHAVAAHDHTAPAHAHGVPDHAHSVSAHTHSTPSHSHSGTSGSTSVDHHHMWLVHETNDFWTWGRDDIYTSGHFNKTTVATGSASTVLSFSGLPSVAHYYTSGARVPTWDTTTDLSHTHSISVSGGSGTSGSGGGGSTGSVAGVSTGSSGSAATSAAALTTDPGGQAATSTVGGTSESGGGTATQASGAVVDNRSAWVGVLKLMRIR